MQCLFSTVAWALSLQQRCCRASPISELCTVIPVASTVSPVCQPVPHYSVTNSPGSQVTELAGPFHCCCPYWLLQPTRSRGIKRSSDPCFRNTLPATQFNQTQQRQHSSSKTVAARARCQIHCTMVAGAHPRAGIPNLLAASTCQVQNLMDLVGSCTQAADTWLLPLAAGTCCCHIGPVTLPSVGLLPLQSLKSETP